MYVKKILVWLLVLAATLLVSACGGNNSATPVSVTLVSIEVTSTNLSIAAGTTTQLTATGIYSDHTTRDITALAAWSSGTTATASISNAANSHGLATSLASGSTTITATYKGVSGSATLVVTAATLTAIEVTPTNPSIALGTQQQFVATGIYSDNSTQPITSSVTWSSASTVVATVSNDTNSSGLVTSVTSGNSIITATSNGISGSTQLTVSAAALTSIEVTPTEPTIALGTQQQFVATGIYSDSSTQPITSSVTWSSASTVVATVSNDTNSSGLVTSVTSGSSIITATSNGISGSTQLTVSGAVLTSIEVTPTNPNIAFGLKTQFTATGIYSDNTTQDITKSVLWISSNSALSISNDIFSHGLADLTSVNTVGRTTITAIQGSISGATVLTVTNATLASITVTPANSNVALGLTVPFTATGIYSDNTTQNLTTFVLWSSSDSAVAKISNAPGSNGLATPVAASASAVTITARSKTGNISGTTSLTVGNPTLTSIAITPGNSSIAFGSTAQFTAIGTYSDSTTQNITKLVTWSSSNPVVATVNNAGDARGLAFLLTPGNITITATLAGVTGTTPLIVANSTLVSIAVTPANPSTTLGSTVQFTAIGTYSDNSTQNLTKLVTWSSATTSIVVVSNAADSNGLAHVVGNASGSSVITAISGSIFGATTLTVP